MSESVSSYARYLWQLSSGSRANLELALARSREQDSVLYGDLAQPLRVLDLANGRLRPQYTILKARGNWVYGIDRINRPRNTFTDTAYVFARGIFRRMLRLPAERHDTLVCGDVGKLPFPAQAFDLVTSVAAFEHFLDVPAVVAEVARVLRPGGGAWIAIHLFTSLSGGHNLPYSEIPVRAIPTGVDAWDHLRARRLPLTVPLNEWRVPQYQEAFARHFEIVKQYCWLREGEALLTPAVQAELAGYERDELTCGTYIIVARKPAQG